MPSLFGIDIQGIVASEIGPGVLDATLVVVTPGTRTPGNLSGGVNPTETNRTGKGFIDNYDDNAIDGTMVQMGDRKIVLITGTFGTPEIAPKRGDKITIEGTTYNVVRTKRDPAAATFTCQARV